MLIKVLVKKGEYHEQRENTVSKMNGLKRMNALTPAQAIILVKLANNQPVSPKSMTVLNSIF